MTNRSSAISLDFGLVAQERIVLRRSVTNRSSAISLDFGLVAQETTECDESF